MNSENLGLFMDAVKHADLTLVEITIKSIDQDAIGFTIEPRDAVKVEAICDKYNFQARQCQHPRYRALTQDVIRYQVTL